MKFDCPRCGKYTTAHRAHIERHYKCKRRCKPLITDLSIDELLSRLPTRCRSIDTITNMYECQVCKKKFPSASSKYNHKVKCTLTLTGFGNESYKPLYYNKSQIMKEIYHKYDKKQYPIVIINNYENDKTNNKKMTTIAVMLLKFLYFDNKINPYNCNICIKNENDKTMYVFNKENNKYIKCDTIETIDKLIKFFLVAMHKHIEKLYNNEIINIDMEDFFRFNFYTYHLSDKVKHNPNSYLVSQLLIFAKEVYEANKDKFVFEE
jgi:hypothetical protein